MTATNRGSTLGHKLEKDSVLGALMVSPALIFLLLMLAYPFMLAVYLSLTDKRVGVEASFVGLENFITLSKTTLFWKSLKNSLVYTVGAQTLKLAGGLALALFLNRDFRGKRAVRAALLLPWIIPTVFSTLAWLWLLDPGFGIVNIMLKDWGLIRAKLPFLVDPTWAMTSLIMVNVWRGVPFFAVTSMAALETVPEELIDASKIDGANAWQRFWLVTLPLIVPIVIIVMLISTIGTISEFELPYLLTHGGPGDATTVYSIVTYNLGMGTGLIGLGSAVSLTMFPILALLVLISLREVRRRGY